MRFENTARFVSAYRPLFLWGYGGFCLAIIALTLFALLFESWGLIPISLALLLLLFSRMFLLLWATYQRLDRPLASYYAFIKQYGLLNPQKDVVYLDLGGRRELLELAQQMINGRFFLVDLFAPHLMPRLHLLRVRQNIPPLPQLPRLEFKNGTTRLLPIQDGSVHLVIMPYVWQEILQEGDRELLLKEVFRILAVSGRLLVIDQYRTPMNWVCLGFLASRLPYLSRIQHQLKAAGFQNPETTHYLQLSHTLISTKPGRTRIRQLPLNLYD